MMLPIAGIAVAVAVTAGAALAMQIRSDIGTAAVFEEREKQLVDMNRRNAELAERHAKAKAGADTVARDVESRYRLAQKDLADAQERAEKAEAAASAAATAKGEPEPCVCTWSSPLPPLR